MEMLNESQRSISGLAGEGRAWGSIADPPECGGAGLGAGHSGGSRGSTGPSLKGNFYEQPPSRGQVPGEGAGSVHAAVMPALTAQ